jgi:penicillin-binding protein 1A
MFLAAILTVGAMIFLAALLIYPGLPSLETLTDYRPKIPLRVYTSDAALIGEFGEERRALIRVQDVPEGMRQAILAAEDERFYHHGGVDYIGILRAALSNLIAGAAREGASTITMQVARNFFLTREKTLTRKFSEVLLALKIEGNLSKDQILELYINQIYLGQRAYGFAAASQVYYGKPLKELNLAEMAMLAGLPKAPSRYNPVINLERAKERQHYVLRRMHDLDYLDDSQYRNALELPLRINRERPVFEVSADYVAEMVRQFMYDKYQESAYGKGFKVYTTLRRMDQIAANNALRKGVLDYDRRHGYRGPEGSIKGVDDLEKETQALNDALQSVPEINGLKPAVVLFAAPKVVRLYAKGGQIIEVRDKGLEFVQKMLVPASKGARLNRGALIRIEKTPDGFWQIAQLPKVEAAIVSMDPNDGAIRALAGGFDFSLNKFNHVIQAWRQPGSSFKPFVYSAALEKGFTPATVINDAPIVINSEETGGEMWEPQNYDGTFSGPTRMRVALTKSKNLVSIRIIQSIGAQYAQDYVTRFGFSADKHPPYLTMALGAGSVTPLQMVTAYSVFANRGYLIKPYYIERVLDANGNVLAEAHPIHAGQDAQQVIDERNTFIMTSMMQDVVERGTAARAMQLGRQDLAGKTGTTNDQMDAWFAGYNQDLTAVAWIGYDQPHSLGSVETSAQAALPIWMEYMGAVLKGTPEKPLVPPAGVVVAHIHPDTGLRVPADSGGLVEYFYQENIPAEQGLGGPGLFGGGTQSSEELKNQLF